MEETERKHSTMAEGQQKKIGIWGAMVMAALGLIFLIFWVVNVTLVQHGQTDLADNALLPVPTLMMLAGLGGFVLIRKNRLVEGLWLVYLAVLVPPVIAVLVIVDFYIIGLAYLAAFAPAAIVWAMPRAGRRTAIIATALAILGIVGIEALHPAFRVTAGNLAGFAPYAIAVAVLALIAFYARQAMVFLSLRTKLTLAFSAISILIVFGTVYVLYNGQKNQSLQEFRSRVTGAVAIAALQQNGDEFARITSDQNPLYEKFRLQNLKIRQSDPLYRYVWTASRDNSGFYFVVDAGEPSEEGFSKFGERYAEPGATLTKNYDTMTKPIAEPEIYTDEYGSFISAYAPIFTSDGKRVGVIGIDISAATILQQQQQLLNQAILIGLVAILLSVLLGYAFGYVLTKPISELISGTHRFAAGDLSFRTNILAKDEVGDLGRSFNLMANEIQDLIAGLERRVGAATRNLTLAAEVGRSVGQVHNLDTLLKSAVELIQDRFNLYYTQVYLLDASGRQLVLRAGTGDVGQRLMGRRHSLPVDLASLNGAAAVESRAVIVENTETSSIHRPNPLLPDTRSEMVIPLMVRERVVGTLDMQSSQAGALNKENVSAFEALAGQLAIAVENASLLAETDAARATMEIRSRRLVRSNWQDFLNAVERGERIGYTYNLENMDTCVEPVSPGVNGRDLVTTIPVLNEPVGVFKFEGEQSWSKDDAALVDNIAHQLGQQIENLRLLAQADKYRAEAEQAIVRLTRQGWEAQIAAHPDSATGFTYDLNRISPLIETGNSNLAPTSTQILEVRGEKIGELSIAGTKKTSEDVAELLSAVGAQLSARVENLRLFEETERSQVEVEKRARQLAAVAKVSTVSAKELNVDKMLASVVSLTQRQFGLYHAHIYLNDEKGEELRIAACGWMEGDEHEGSKENTVIALAQERSLVARAAREGRAVIVNDVQGEPGWLPNPLLPDTAAEMAVPLVVGEQILGVLDVQSDRVNAFSEEDASIQTTLASQVAIALQNARSFTQAQRQAERETALNAISQQIQSATTVEAVLQIAARELGRALGAPLTIAQLGLQEQSVAGGNGSNGRN